MEDIQDKFFNLRNTALDALVDLINDIQTEKAKGVTDAQLAQAREYQRKGQFMIDFVMSENSMGFHAPREATRILGDAINFCGSDSSVCTAVRRPVTLRRTLRLSLRGLDWRALTKSEEQGYKRCTAELPSCTFVSFVV